MPPVEGTIPLPRMRRWLLTVVGVGLFGTALDLALLAHYEDVWQLVPFAAILLALATLIAVALIGSSATVRALRAAMLAMIACGVAGIVLHYQGNREFQLEVDPSLSGLDLFVTVLRAKAPPALAPANMALLGLVGLAITLREKERAS
jgi:hypothetical protein